MLAESLGFGWGLLGCWILVGPSLCCLLGCLVVVWCWAVWLIWVGCVLLCSFGLVLCWVMVRPGIGGCARGGVWCNSCFLVVLW